ncbi:hypothetical protein E1B28_002963 [Marasmius oreades]|uniref:Nephrocystin 3-like N-terminal domain-containing protein n=1 Tax=Marasmius oreades TaxID=181124 RepID=A0A9P7RL42_9AGAR|nr:uncharacterized protein E1B28_002963 [Marasmius oreades]KAG7085402.1 hypothetical protein E1B28_002963 [Marasmius oreades]
MMQLVLNLLWKSRLEPPPSSQHILSGAQNTTIGQAVFNNVAGDQVQNHNHNHNHYFTHLLWEAIADVGASHNSEQQVDRGQCLPGTRVAVLKLIRQWRVTECETSPVCWLSGTAGVGKSSIALTVAEECEKDGRNVASFFFFRSDAKRNNPSSLILSIAHGLVLARPHLKSFVEQRIAADPRILKARLEDQYEKLILQNLDHPPPSYDQKMPDLVIIDGLDECGDAAMQRRVLSLIFSTYQQTFHCPLRFLICSRPEAWIQEEFSWFSGLTKHIELDDSFLPHYDIQLYLNHQFQEIRRDPKYSQIVFPDPWPSPEIVWLLVERADGQFIYPSTVIKFIKMEYTLPTDQLRILLDTISNLSSVSSTHSPFNDLDKLYLMVLRANPDRDQLLLHILEMIVVTPAWDDYIGRSPEFIEVVLGLPPGTVSQTLRAMHSVLDVRDREDDIKIYHKSFTDFLLDQTRSREFFINQSEWEDFLACRWTRSLTEQCRKNPGLLSRHRYLSHSLWMLVNHWNRCLDRVDGRMSSALTSELDAFYHVALSISAELVGRDMLLHILATFLQPGSHSQSPKFLQVLLGLRSEVLDQALVPMDTFISDLDYPPFDQIQIRNTHTTLRDFLLDRSRSRRFFIDKGSQSNFLALRYLFLLQMNDSVVHVESVSPASMKFTEWAGICTNIDNPTEELLFELNRMGLGVVLAKYFNLGAYNLFRDFETISTWLESKTNGITPLNLIVRFRNVQRGFHIRSTRQDVDSGRHHNVITMIILSIVKWASPAQSTRRVCASLIMRDYVDYWSKSFRASVNIELHSAEFCGCSGHAFNSDCVSTPIPDKKDLYHISIPAGCAQIFKAFVAGLEAHKTRRFTHEEYCSLTYKLLVECPSLLTRCLPLPELLPHFRTLLDVAKTLELGGVHYYHRISLRSGGSRSVRSGESRSKLLSWFENFPADCADEVETVKNKLLSLMPLHK